ncbi:Asp-tRNA(Asn)/Glu-tRNA(Gln) amidotransferase subunit GatC [Siphonobacter aquaeclarae]|jgi:aspartyl-tRNA(Asn)/glutamyl-tRNA(Gln) amidotransferase subunit C|uniref:Aspartyl/glutamyl-tRNA(Asn/Gln) amidotransferase subunit C n=1 Tax=Siphonobacter aquaeclarae TaxID=563176 RepID=A0A1G9WQF6_9BACT|nr:Asp-tRNA(Asn)/Glu-tRNA(Gln) amidotransferase subunit GatC [Siphonobacter aquaeclarae]MBO9640027.1 Asp-tRNA(Asn)/Glu-tRNA(Gln) amidotransferase subunit GatC [Siphonobacter aquaeclarae]SDM86804.1 aspartyl/glutamyl-tRNA(Asn/Gln) amidotransferase subunit C [Siphonobacter aquaeclarae]
MQVDKDTLQKIAQLARLEIQPGEEESLKATLSSVLTWMEQLNELDTSGIEPLTHMSVEVNAFRPDVAKQTLTTEQGLLNAPKRDEQFFRVPKVLE